ncbi:hypothetical protein AGDE_14998 [Angomonas deanei]|uniref:RING-type domain-containing protein n=1 Tax=Angomonas deanei TaxID=59799 RepID=A0A7G2CMS4_9TRYP|nr:hypothetical protein AGDE_14998 [Angomonas deanei]CAD2220211.1 hypothetical protein, conserved [Angomonas deanei]|eukprot:EPY19857.1 hypothetical protein AGDE_14998 [Angomonas deanei]
MSKIKNQFSSANPLYHPSPYVLSLLTFSLVEREEMTMSGSSSNSIRYSEGRFLVVEEEEVDQDLLCPSCHCLRENPKECTPCAHIFCAACITGADHCPECSQAIRGLKNPNRFLLHVTDQVHLQCAGCSWSGTVDASSSHRCEEQTKFVEAFKKTKKTPVGSKSTGKVKKAEETESELLRNYTNIDEEEGPYDLSDVPLPRGTTTTHRQSLSTRRGDEEVCHRTAAPQRVRLYGERVGLCRTKCPERK